MLIHYNCILIGCFKDIFQSVHTNDLAAVLQALKELNFPLELQQVSAEEVPNFV